MKKMLFVLLLASIAVPAWAQTSAGDIETATQKVMMQSSQENNNDLRDQMGQVQRTNRNKAAMREHSAAIRPKSDGTREPNAVLQGKNGTQGILIGLRPVPHSQASLGDVQKQADEAQDHKDGLGQVSEDQSHRIQEYQNRHQKAQRTLSNMMKKSSDTQSGIVGNMK